MATKVVTGAKLDFSKFKDAVSRKFNAMTQHDLYRTNVSKDEMWQTYLAAFPPGTDPIFRERTQHDCSCCRHFIYAVGNVVTIDDGIVSSIWDYKTGDPVYDEVSAAMARLVESRPVEDVFLYPEKHAGTDKNYENSDGKIMTWDHFHVNIPSQRNTGKNFYCEKGGIAHFLGEKRTTHEVILRALTELTPDAVDTVLEIIPSIYRGNDYKHSVTQFQSLQKKFLKLKTDRARDLFAWSHVDVPKPISHIRNTAIGTLLIDLSNGDDLEKAVRKFETSIMAPQNFKRSSALVSQAMVDKAKATIEELGLTDALERRFATLNDVSVNDIIFANRTASKKLKGGDAFDNIATRKPVAGRGRALGKVDMISIDDFIKNVVPKVDTIEIMFDNKHVNNLVSLIAPQHKGSARLFKWDNDFSWAYNGDVTDSIKERVKRAGGVVDADVCFRLAWYNTDDLDLHLREPNFHIHFGSRVSHTGGKLDVDMNVCNLVRDPVENIFYSDHTRMTEGEYDLFVNNFCKRESTDVGFEVECDLLGERVNITYAKAVRDKESVRVMRFRYKRGGKIEIIESLPSSKVSKEVWGIKTQEWHAVNIMCLSPNYWDDTKPTGNKHYMFMLDGCVNDGNPRGFFNEYMRSELETHRKVIEIVGSKLRVLESANQLSGLGFSETKRDEILVRVKGSVTRQFQVRF
jgi:hypothetical protein